MKKVTAVGKYGNVVSKEVDDNNLVNQDGSRVNHNSITYDMFKDFIDSLEDKSLNGITLVDVWPNAFLIAKNLEMMVYLDDVNEQNPSNSVVVIVPNDFSESQLAYYENNYLDSLDTFIGLYCDNGEFKQIKNLLLTSDQLYDELKNILKVKKKINKKLLK